MKGASREAGYAHRRTQGKRLADFVVDGRVSGGKSAPEKLSMHLIVEEALRRHR
jgi:hypothetical protein